MHIFFAIASLVFSFFTTWLFRKWAIRKAVLDIPNQRSSHSVPTPRGGGLAIVVAWYIAIFIFYLTGLIQENLFFALLSGIVLVILGLLDDLYSLPSIIRLFVQILVVVATLYFLNADEIFLTGVASIRMNWLLLVVAGIGLIWFINLFNFLDGIDGYAGMESLFILMAIYFFTGNFLMIILSAAVLGFLFWNWQPAKIFMGDVGSTTLGFFLGVFALYYAGSGSLPLLVFLIISALFWFDATITILRRFFNREQLTQAHRKHAYQRIVQSGFSHQKTVLLALGINCVLFFLSWAAYRYEGWAYFVFIFTIVFLFIVLKAIDYRKAFRES